ncbi:MAG: hypothetical protein ABIO72_05675 [Patescibacteria group bacterium]
MIGKILQKLRQKLALFFIVAITVNFSVPANLIIPAANAAIPSTVGYQGRLKDSSNNFLTGTYSFTFRLYNASTGGASLWTETQPTVSASAGAFSVLLGSVTPFPTTLDFNEALFLSTEVNGDGEMAPRVTINTVPYAFTAGGVSSNPVAPTSTVTGGRMFYNTTDGSLQYYDDTLATWRTLGTSSATAETFQSVTNRSNTTTNDIQFGGGTSTGAFTVASPFTVTASSSLQDVTFAHATGSSIAASTGSFASLFTSSFNSTNLSWTNATGTNASLTNAFVTNGVITNATTTNLFATSASIGNLTLTSPLTVGGLNWTNATGTNSTSTNLFATNLGATNGTLNSAAITSLSFTSATGSSILASNGTVTNLTATNATVTSLFVSGLSFGNGTSTGLFNFASASGSSLFVNGQAVCLADGTNCIASSGGTLQSVTNAGNITTSTIQFAGGTSTGALAITNDLSVTGTLTVGGAASLQATTFTSGTGTNLFATSLFFTNSQGTSVTTTNSFTTNGTITNATITDGSITNLSFGNGTSSGIFGFATATGTTINAISGTINTLTAPTLISSNATISGGTINNTSIGGTTPSTGIFTNTTSTNSTSTNLFATTLSATNATIGSLTLTAPLTVSGFTWTNATGTNTTSTNLFATNLFATNGTVTNGAITSLSFTSATGTTFLATSGTITNLTSTNGTIATLNATNGTITTLLATNATATSLFASNLTFGSASGASLLVDGQQVCLANGTNCPSGTAANFQTVTNAGNTTTNAIQFAGGTSTGPFAITDNLTITGTLSVTGGTTLSTLTFTNATGTNVTSTGIYATSLGATNATITNGSIVNATSSFLGITTGITTNLLPTADATLSLGSSALRWNAVFGNVTSTSVTSTNLFVTNGTIATLNATNATIPTLNSNNGTITSLSFTSATGTNFLATSGTITTLTAPTLISSNATISGGTINGTTIGASTPSTGVFTNVTSTNLFATSGALTTLAVSGASALGTLTFTNATGQNVTSTGVFATSLGATNATITNATVSTLNSTNGTITSLSFTSATGTNFLATSGTITNLVTGNVTATTLFVTNLSATNFTPTNLSVANLTWTNATGTNTTSTNLFATNLFFTNSQGTSVTTTNSFTTNGTITNATITNGTITALNFGSGTSTGIFGFATATGTTINAISGTINTLTAPTLISSNATISGGIINNTSIGGVAPSTGIFTNTTSTNSTSTNLFATTFGATNATIGSLTLTAPLTVSGLTWTNATGVNTTSTNLFATNLFATNGTVTNGTITSLSFTSATGANFLATSGTITNLTSTNGTVTSLSFTSATGTNFLATSGTITNLTSTNGTIATLNATNGTITTLLSTNATATSLFASSLTFGAASGASLLVSGQQVCLANGTNCPTGTTQTFQTVTNAGNTTTNAIQFAGGTSTGAFSITNNLTVTGTLAVTGGTTLSTLTFSNATGTNVTSTGIFATSLGATNASITNGSIVNATSSFLGITTGVTTNLLPTADAVLSLGSSALRWNAVFGSVTSTSVTSTNLFATNGTIATLNATNATIPTFTSNNGTITSLSFTSATGTNFLATSGTITTLTAPTLVTSNATISGGTINGTTIGASTPSTGVFTNVTSTNLFATSGALTTLTVNGASALGTLTFTNATGQNVTSTGVFATSLGATNATINTATITNGTVSTLNSNNGTITSLSFTSATGTNFLATSGTITNLVTGNATATTLFVSNLSATNFSPTNLTWTNATGTNTTSTNLFATNLFFTNSQGGSVTTTNSFTTNGTITNGTITNGTITTLSFGSGTSTGIFGFATATGTTINAISGTINTLTAPTLLSSNVTISGGTINNTSIGGTTPSTGIFTNTTSTNSTSTNLFATTFSATNAIIGSLTLTNPLTVSGLTWTNATGVNTTSTNLFATNLFATNGTVTNGTITSLLFTSATGANFLATSGTITNLTSTNGTIATLNATNGTITTLLSANATATSLFASGLTFGSASGLSLLVSGQQVCLADGTNCPSGTAANFQTVTNAGNTTTNAIQFNGGTSTAAFTTTELVVNSTAGGIGNFGGSPTQVLISSLDGTYWNQVYQNETANANFPTSTAQWANFVSDQGDFQFWSVNGPAGDSHEFLTFVTPEQEIAFATNGPGGVYLPEAGLTLAPFGSNTNDLGLANAAWRNLYVGGISFTDASGTNVTTTNLGVLGALTAAKGAIVNATSSFLGITTGVTTNLLPTADAVLSLGSSALRWNAIFGSVTSTNVTSTNLFTTNSTITNLVTGNATASTLFVSNFSVGNFNPTSLTWTNATGTNTTSTNLFATNLVATNGTVSNGTITSLSFTSATGTNFLATSGTITTLTATNATATSLFATGLTFGSASGLSLLVGGQQVCLANGTNCPVSGGSGSNYWSYNSANDTMYPASSTVDVLLGGATVASAPFRFLATTTNSRMFVGAYGSSTDIVLGAATASITHTAFQLDGGDLFVAGNIGSASSVYTNGTYNAGTQTLLGNGFLTKSSGDFTVDAAGVVYVQPDGGSMKIGGTDAPQAMLEVGAGTHGATLGGSYDIGINSAGRAGLGLVDSTNGLGEVLMGFASGIEALMVGTVTTHPLFFETDNTIRGNVSTIGNFSIGKTTSDAVTRLEVYGITSSTGMSSGNLLPHRNNTYDLGSATRSWANIYASGTIAGVTVTTTNLRVNGQLVCLANGTNCPAAPGGGGSNFFSYDTARDITFLTTTTADVLIGGATKETSAFYFNTQSTTSRLFVGAYGSSTDVLIGATTGTITNSGFQLTGDDLFVAGSIGSAGSVYTNGGVFAAGVVSSSSMVTQTLTADTVITTTLTVNGQQVCLANSVNCPPGGGGSSGAVTYDFANDIVRLTTSTSDFLIGGAFTNMSPFWFQTQSTSSRLYIGAYGSSTDVVIGSGTSTITNTGFQLSGDDIFVAGSIGSASSIYTNGDIYAEGTVSSSRFAGAGLTSCSGIDSKLLWDATTQRFSCGRDTEGNVVSTTTNSVLALGQATGTFKGVMTATTTPFSTNSEIWVVAVAQFNNVGTVLRDVGAQVWRGSENGCTSTNQVLATTTTVDNLAAAATARTVVTLSFVDSPATTTATGYTLCAKTSSKNGGIPTVSASSLTLTEVNVGADLAEVYYSEESLMAADVVSLDPAKEGQILLSNGRNDANVLGVVSTRPGLVISQLDGSGTAYTVALAGRVPVKVSLENGPIYAGDSLAPASKPGYAMKATKAGMVLGRALSDFTGAEDPETGETATTGKVMMFVENGFYSGTSLVAPEVTGSSMLSWLLNQQLTSSTSTVDILTRRVMAEAEVIAPKVTTQELGVDTINVLSQSGALTMNLRNDNSFVIKNASSTDPENASSTGSVLFSIDSLGNAVFAGTITANSIAGLSTLIQQAIASSTLSAQSIAEVISQLSTSTLQVAGVTSSALTVNGDAIITGTVSTTRLVANEIQSPLLETLFARADEITSSTASLSARISELEAVNAEDLVQATSSLSIESQPTILNGGLQVDTISSISDQLTILSDTFFIGRPYFNVDTAGFAKVQANHRSVDIVFEKEYLAQPIANATISLDEESSEATQDPTYIQGQREEELFQENLTFVITNKSTKGFTILLNKRAEQDVVFSWNAFAVKDAKIFFSAATSTWNVDPNAPVFGPALDPTPPQIDPGASSSTGSTQATEPESPTEPVPEVIGNEETTTPEEVPVPDAEEVTPDEGPTVPDPAPMTEPPADPAPTP